MQSQLFIPSLLVLAVSSSMAQSISDITKSFNQDIERRLRDNQPRDRPKLALDEEPPVQRLQAENNRLRRLIDQQAEKILLLESRLKQLETAK